MSVPVVGRPGPSPGQLQAAAELEQTIRRGRTRRKPSTVPQDVWEVVEEMEQNGGLYDFNVEIARLEKEFDRLDELAKMDGEILPIEHLRMRIKLAERLISAKERALNAQLKTKDVVTVDILRLCMEAVATALRQNISDVHLIQRIGDQIGEAFRSALAQARRAA